jgi:hypothetical protein
MTPFPSARSAGAICSARNLTDDDGRHLASLHTVDDVEDSRPPRLSHLEEPRAKAVSPTIYAV